jgi:hypothetical protein
LFALIFAVSNMIVGPLVASEGNGERLPVTDQEHEGHHG